MKKFTTRMLCRASIISALYTVMTFAMGELAFGYVQIRPAEAFCLLPLLFVESVPALFIGCMLANFFSSFGIIDVLVGSLISLLASLCTYLIGKLVKKEYLKVILGGLPPVLLNAFGLPIIWLICGVEVAYFVEVFAIFISQSIFVYGLGIPLYFTIRRIETKKNNSSIDED